MKILRKFRNKNSGFTLAEVLVSVIIGALVVVPMLSSFLMGRASTEVAKHRTQAMNVIRARMEYLQSKGYNYINSLPPEEYYQELYLDENESGEAIPCMCTTMVTDMDGDDLLEVEVTVHWQERRLGSGNSSWESVTTLFAPIRSFE